jgi:hypothetical protein
MEGMREDLQKSWEKILPEVTYHSFTRESDLPPTADSSKNQRTYPEMRFNDDFAFLIFLKLCRKYKVKYKELEHRVLRIKVPDDAMHADVLEMLLSCVILRQLWNLLEEDGKESEEIANCYEWC